MAIGEAKFDDWMSTYQEVFATPDRVPETACPNCANYNLHLVLVVPHIENLHGWAAFWCGHCMTGVALGLAEVRPGMRILVSRAGGRGVSEEIPDYTMIV